jgi:hypothetical protein
MMPAYPMPNVFAQRLGMQPWPPQQPAVGFQQPAVGFPPGPVAMPGQGVMPLPGQQAAPPVGGWTPESPIGRAPMPPIGVGPQMPLPRPPVAPGGPNGAPGMMNAQQFDPRLQNAFAQRARMIQQ